MLSQEEKSNRKAPLPIWAIVFTILWLVLIAFAIWRDWCRFKGMPLNELGDFLAGFFAPIAFCWLVVGYVLQRRQLTMSLEALAAEREALLEERKMRLMSLYPRLSVRSGMRVRGGEFRQTIHVRNFGGPSVETVVHVNSRDDGGYIDLGPINQGEEKTFEWRFYKDYEKIPVIVSMRDSMNTLHQCTFTMIRTNDDFDLLDVETNPAGS